MQDSDSIRLVWTRGIARGVAIACASIFVAFSLRAEPLFDNPKLGFSLNSLPRYVATPDLNGDGHKDLAWSTNRNLNASVNEDLVTLLSNGDGTFQERIAIEIAPNIREMEFADFDEDGTLDLVTRGNQQGMDYVFLPGNGDGTFGTAQPLGVGIPQMSIYVEVGDVDGDDTLDLAFRSGGLSGTPIGGILLGNGDGTFQSLIPLPLASTAIGALKLGHIDGDAHLDLVVCIAATCNVLSGVGDGTFTQGAVLTPIGGDARDPVLADVDGDGHLDVLSPDAGSSGHESLSVFLGDGTGAFLAPTQVSLSPFTHFGGITAEDFDLDGNLDLVAGTSPGDAYLYKGAGDGTFGGPILLHTEVGTPFLTFVSDVNEDGVPDLVASHSAFYDVTVYPGKGDGTLRTPATLTAGINPRSVTIADLDGNSVPDLVLGKVHNASTIAVAIGRGDGSFETPAPLAVGRNPSRTLVSDFDGDDVPDLMSYSGDDVQLELLIGNGDGTFQSPIVAQSVVTTFGAGDPVSADFDSDGAEDVAILVTGGMLVSLGNGDGTFQTGNLYAAAGASRDATAADVNGDSAIDFIIANRDGGTVSVLLGNGDGTFQAALSHAVGTNPTNLAVGDLNGDGVVDLVTNTSIHHVSVSLGLGDGSFAPATLVYVKWFAGEVVIEDFDGDSISDIGVRINNQAVCVVRGVGNGTFGDPEVYEIVGTAFAAADLDRDGAVDLVSVDTTFAGQNDVKIGLARRFAIDLVPVVDPANTPDPATGKGEVPVLYGVSRGEIKVAQYAAFLNAVATSDPMGLYDPLMGSGPQGGITRVGSDGTYQYRIDPERDRYPIGFVSFPDAMRFANWLHNGRPSGAQDASTTEDGAYTLTGPGLASNSIVRNPQALYAIPTDDEWYKAAYFNPASSTYHAYPTGSDTQPTCGLPGLAPDLANCTGGAGTTASIGTYPASASPVGGLDLAGNVEEWTETIGGLGRVVRGGSFATTAAEAERTTSSSADPEAQSDTRGFRVVPEPGLVPLLGVGVLGLLGLARAPRTKHRHIARE